MELLDRYLHAVGFWLPKPQRDDILAELSDDIRSQIDHREAELGRKLDAAEVEAMLNHWGNPLVVAGRYLPQPYLIGPVLYPLYILVLKIVAVVYVVPWLLVWMGLMLFSPTYRGDGFSLSRLGDLWTLLSIVAYLFLFITIGFAYFDRFKIQSWLKQDWTSQKLPVKSDPNVIPRSSSAVELAVNLVVALWWLDLPRIGELWNPSGEGIALTTIWSTLYWPVFLLLVAGIGLGVLNLMWPYRTRIHVGLSLARSVYCLILLGILMSAGSLVEIAAPDRPAAEVANAEQWLTISVVVTLAIIGIGCLVGIVQDARRMLRTS